MHELQTVDDDDGLPIAEVGLWSEEKYRLVSTYAGIFTASMRKKFASLVYIDLFAGPGRARIKDTKRLYASSPMNALEVDPSFDRLIFCEKDASRLAALKERCTAQHSDRDIHFIDGDVNEKASEILHRIPQHRSDRGVLSLCFVDPYMLNDLRFTTLRALSERWIDFLVLIPSEMDAQRNEHIYVPEGNSAIADFVGSDNWRIRWRAARSGLRFGHFLVEEFGRSMERLGRRRLALHDAWQMKNSRKREIYQLALYSRKELGGRFWREAKKAVSPNFELGL